MDRDTFIVNTNKLFHCAKDARIVSEAFGCDIDCEGFIGDLINGYGSLILTSAVNKPEEEIPDEEREIFWNLLVTSDDDEAALNTIAAFYDERIGK